jgi:hypothetical protein
MNGTAAGKHITFLPLREYAVHTGTLNSLPY